MSNVLFWLQPERGLGLPPLTVHKYSICISECGTPEVQSTIGMESRVLSSLTGPISDPDNVIG